MAPADRGRGGPDLALEATARALAALDELPDGAAVLRPVRDDAGVVIDLVYAYANRRAGEAAGMASSELLGRGLLESLPAFPRELFEALVAVLAGGDPLHGEMDHREAFRRHPKFSGHFELSASRLGDALLVVYADLEARARSRTVEERFGAVLGATSDWVSIADRDLKLVYVNAGGRAMVGMEPDEDVTSRSIGAFSPRWARDYVRREALEVALREGVWRGDLARLHRDGREIPVSQVIVASKDATGEVEFYATIARDMTRERIAEAALSASEERFRIAFEQAPIGVALLDLEGHYLQVNDAYCRTVRRTREELVGGRPADITHPDDVPDSLHAVERLVAGDWDEYSFEKRYLTADGETVWAELSATVFRDDEGRPQFLIGMIQDVGERRVAQTLQRSMLTRLPQIGGVDLAARYLPGSRETEVCGDWYDVIPLPGGRVGVVIGDVVGRGLEAAATMSQLRTGVRAYAIEGHEPADVVRRLQLLADHLPEGLGTTLVYLELDPRTRELRYVSAGHLPVLHVAPSGESSFLPGGRSTPLGTLEPGVAVPQASIVLAPGASVLLYTDGLVERRDDGIESRLGQLRAAMATAPADLDDCLGHLTAVLLGDGVRVDDVALLMLRVTAGTSPPSRLSR